MARLKFVLPFLLLSVAPAFADDVPGAPDQSAIKDVISQQLDAFGKGDGVAAEAFASPMIQQKFASPEAFMGMVKSGYGALIRPKSTRFESLDQTPLGLVQKMSVVDSSGVLWTVAYTMTQVDGKWRISGCFLLKSDAVNA